MATVKPVVENKTDDFNSDLGKAVSFSVENVGTVDAELRFDESEATALLPAGTTREFAYVGEFYTGMLYGRFLLAEGQEQPVRRITIIKTVRICD